MRTKPSLSSSVVATLAWDAVAVPNIDPRYPQLEWLDVETVDGRLGWVQNRFVEPEFDTSVCFTRQSNGRWVIQAVDVPSG
jgi:hypothetical protein